MSILKKIVTYTGLVLLYLMVVFPMTLNLLYVKAGLFGLLCLMTVFYWVVRLRLNLHWHVLIWGVLVTGIGVFFSFTGALESTPGAIKQLQVYGFWPLVYTAVLAGASEERVLTRIHETLVVATITIALYGLIVLLTAVGELPHFAIVEWLSFEEEEGGGFADGFFAIRYQGMNSLPFLIPYMMASLNAGLESRGNTPSGKLLIWTALILSLFVAVISGRRGLQVVVVLSPLIVIWLSRHQGPSQRSQTRASMGGLAVACAAIVALFFVYLGSTYNTSFGDMIASFMTGFDFSGVDSESTYVRREQWYALLWGWEQHPILGNGHGASAAGSIRSLEMPWAYELYYVALLFQVGLVGFFAYFAAMAWIYWKGAAVIRHGAALGQLMFASLVGLTGVLIASATNPYLARFDGWWVVFLPLAIINRWLLRQDTGGGRPSTQLSIVP